jgi:hypothetical protein
VAPAIARAIWATPTGPGWREFPPGDLARLAASIAGAMGA